jgi:hypothetical protein
MLENQRIEAIESNSHMVVKVLGKHNRASFAECAAELVVPAALTGELVPLLRDCLQIVRAVNLADLSGNLFGYVHSYT